MKIAVVILNWNGQKLLEQFLPSVMAFTKEATIYVADNASRDDSVLFLKTNYPEIQIIKNEGNYGFAKGYNEALQSIDADVFALVNSDIEVTENWLQPILKTFRNEPETAIIQPKILDYKNKKCFEYAGAAGGFIDKYGYPFCRGRVFETIEEDTKQYNDNAAIFWASGACFFIRKLVFEALNGFNEDFFAHQEEIDLCWRAFNKNHIIKYCYESTVYHVGGATLEKSNPQKTYLNFRNSLLMLLRNLPSNKIFSVIFVRLLLDGLAALQFLIKGQFRHFLAVIQAHFSFYFKIISTFKKRNGPHKQHYFYQKSIVYQYFIKKGIVFEKRFNNSL